MANGVPSFQGYALIAKAMFGAMGAGIVASILLAGVAALLGGQAFRRLLGFILPFSLLGIVVGYIAGSTKEALVGALLSGVLTLVGALLSYTFTRDATGDGRELLPHAVAMLSAGALMGLFAGHLSRTEQDVYERSYAEWLERYQKADIPAIALRVKHQKCKDFSEKENRAKCDEILLR